MRLIRPLRLSYIADTFIALHSDIYYPHLVSITRSRPWISQRDTFITLPWDAPLRDIIDTPQRDTFITRIGMHHSMTDLLPCGVTDLLPCSVTVLLRYPGTPRSAR